MDLRKNVRRLLGLRDKPGAKAATVSAKIHHADGTVTDVGIVGTGAVYMDPKGR